jgi:uncharacterized protein
MNERNVDFPYRRALVTGAGSGLGAKLCELLASAGCAVWGVSRDKGRVPSCATPVKLDLADSSALAAFIDDELPEIAPDLLVNCAGNGVFGRIEEQSDADIRAQIDVMFVAPALLCRAAIPAMRTAGRGCIANVSSMAVDFPLPCMPGYNAAKSGLSALSASLAEDLAGTGIYVVDFRPGDFSSGFFKATKRVGGSDKAWAAAEKHLECAPDSEWMAHKLFDAVARGKSGTARAGTFFQTKLAPFGAKVLPEALFSKLKKRYLG